MITTSTPTRIYVLPEEAEQAKSALIGILANPHETWISAYGLSFGPLVERICAAAKSGVVIHVLLDHTQAGGKSTAAYLPALHAAGVDVAIGCSRAGGAINHDKTIVTIDPKGASAVGFGSLNFTLPAFNENNLYAVSADPVLAAALAGRIAQQIRWNRAMHPDWQHPHP